MTETIQKLDEDKVMCEEQLASLDSKPVYKVPIFILFSFQ